MTALIALTSTAQRGGGLHPLDLLAQRSLSVAGEPDKDCRRPIFLFLGADFFFDSTLAPVEKSLPPTADNGSLSRRISE